MNRLFLQWPKKKLRRVSQRILWIVVGMVLSLAILGGLRVIQNSQTPLGFSEIEPTASWLPKTVTRYQTIVQSMSRRYDINPQLVYIIMTLESGGSKTADSGQANGLMQITPYTAKDIASKHLEKPQLKFDLSDPSTNIEFGVAYLAYLRNSFCDHTDGPTWDSCVEAIAAGYNGGPGAAISLIEGKGLIDTQTVIYSRNAFNMWRERGAKTSPTYIRWLEAGGQSLVDAASQQSR